jgi:DNA polymerase-1
VAGRDGRVIAGWGADAADGLRRMVEARGIPIVAHEAKPILETRFAGDADAETTPVEFDTQIAAYILNAALRSQSIADVVAERLDLVLPPPKELEPVHRAGLEALSALAVRDPLARALQEEGLERLFREIELPLIPVLARMEAMGIAVDLEALAVLDREFRTEIERLEAEIYAAVGHQFTIGSPKQLGDILFVELTDRRGTGFRCACRHRRWSW